MGKHRHDEQFIRAGYENPLVQYCFYFHSEHAYAHTVSTNTCIPKGRGKHRAKNAKAA